jgi:hypothetical protein
MCFLRFQFCLICTVVCNFPDLSELCSVVCNFYVPVLSELCNVVCVLRFLILLNSVL